MILRTIYSILLALDLLASALTGGKPLETISARLARARAANRSGMGARVANAVDAVFAKLFGERNHCASALAAYIARNKAATAWSG